MVEIDPAEQRRFAVVAMHADEGAEKDPFEVPKARSPGMIPLASAAEPDRLVTEAELSGRGDRLIEPRSIVRARGAVPGGGAAAETVCRAGRAQLEVDARGKHEAGP